MTRLQDWELETIEALATEALESLSRKEYVRQPDRFLETYVADLQRDALAGANVRKTLIRAAERLGIGTHHPPKITANDPLGYTPAPCPPEILAHIQTKLRTIGTMPQRSAHPTEAPTEAPPLSTFAATLERARARTQQP